VLLLLRRYHKRRLNGPPGASEKKEVLIAYLDKHSVPHPPRATKVELLSLAREHADKSPKYAVTEIAAKYGFEVIYTPPYVSVFRGCRAWRLPEPAFALSHVGNAPCCWMWSCGRCFIAAALRAARD
jgi:hypothetical protein